MLLIRYNQYNSGLKNWINREDWIALEKAGWKLFGFDDFVLNKEKNCVYGIDKLPLRKGAWKNPEFAYKFFVSPKEALIEVATLIKRDITEDQWEGNMNPHCFSWEGGSCSERSCFKYLYGEYLCLCKVCNKIIGWFYKEEHPNPFNKSTFNETQFGTCTSCFISSPQFLSERK